jgi:putative RNA 2'-phosphotransferase
MKNTEISKLISFWLRHKPTDGQLELDEFGRANIDLLIKSLNSENIDLLKSELIELNNSFDKKRWEIDEQKNTIRATHGHSIFVEQLLSPTTPPKTLYHGTSMKNIRQIFNDGLRKMDREYVHLSANPIDALKVGSRHGKSILIEIGTEVLLANKFEFYNTENDIWLSNNIPSRHLELTPWCKIENGGGQDSMKSELEKEIRTDDSDITPEILKSLSATWRDQRNDEVLFETPDCELYQIHLTWKSSTERSGWPIRRQYNSFEEWLKKEVVQSQKDYYELNE